MQKPKAEAMQEAAAAPSDIKRLLGDIDATAMASVLSLRPTLAEVEEAALRLAGDSDILGKAGKPPTARIVQIMDIVGADDDEDEMPFRR